MFYFTQEPFGSHPTQGEGIIEKTGQAFYFRYRGGRASLTISHDDRVVCGREGSEGVARYYEQRVVNQAAPLPAACDDDVQLASENTMPLEQSTALVTAWLTLYLAQPRQHPALAAIQRSSRWS